MQRKRIFNAKRAGSSDYLRYKREFKAMFRDGTLNGKHGRDVEADALQCIRMPESLYDVVYGRAYFQAKYEVTKIRGAKRNAESAKTIMLEMQRMRTKSIARPKKKL